MDELGQKKFDLLKEESDRISKELFEIEEGGIILDSGNVVPLGGYGYRNELKKKYSEIFQEMLKLNDGKKWW